MKGWYLVLVFCAAFLGSIFTRMVLIPWMDKDTPPVPSYTAVVYCPAAPPTAVIRVTGYAHYQSALYVYRRGAEHIEFSSTCSLRRVP